MNEEKYCYRRERGERRGIEMVRVTGFLRDLCDLSGKSLLAGSGANLRRLAAVVVFAWPLLAQSAPDPLVITTEAIQSIVATVPHAEIVTFKAKGGTPPYTWGVLNGPLPTGTKLETATGILSGAVSEASGERGYSFTISVTDAAGEKVAKPFALHVRPSMQPDKRQTVPPYVWGLLLLPGLALLWFVIRHAKRGNKHSST